MSTIEGNPKDAAGRTKLPLHLWPASATAAGSIGFLEGELKYGRNNFRASPVAASVYVAAAKRHIDAWFEGQDSALDTGSPHLGNALACLAIIIEAQVSSTLIDDRNFTPSPGAYDAWASTLTAQSASLKRQFAKHGPKHWDRRDQIAAEQATAKTMMESEAPCTDPDCPACNPSENLVSLAEALNKQFGTTKKAPTADNIKAALKTLLDAGVLTAV